MIHKHQAVNAHGTDDYPNRKLQYAADELGMDFDDDGLVQKINGQTQRPVCAVTDASETDVTADHVEMNFDPMDNESLLTRSRHRQRRGDLEAAAGAGTAVERNPRAAQRDAGNEDAAGRKEIESGHHSARHAGVPAQSAGRSTTARSTARNS